MLHEIGKNLAPRETVARPGPRPCARVGRCAQMGRRASSRTTVVFAASCKEVDFAKIKGVLV
ncbi:MAG: hypothetical protein NTU95_12230 [Methanothrix sp.]|nr:hypothetical protein [Methanothrix sp.]